MNNFQKNETDFSASGTPSFNPCYKGKYIHIPSLNTEKQRVFVWKWEYKTKN